MANRGRPGRPAKPEWWVHHDPICCRHCGSRYTPPYQTAPYTEIDQGGTAPNGRPYTHVSWRNATCSRCGQPVIVRVLENRGE